MVVSLEAEGGAGSVVNVGVGSDEYSFFYIKNGSLSRSVLWIYRTSSSCNNLQHNIVMILL